MSAQQDSMGNKLSTRSFFRHYGHVKLIELESRCKTERDIEKIVPEPEIRDF